MDTPRTLLSLSTAGALVAGALLAVSTGTTARAHGGDDDDDRKQVFRGKLVELNGSGVHGAVKVVDRNGTLRVKLKARGLEPGQMHMAHIHGHGPTGDATCPTMDLAGSDGILSVGEGAPAYGPVWVTIANDPVERGRLKFKRMFETTDTGGPGKGDSVDTMGSLGRYAVVVHGLTADDDGDAGNGVSGGYQPLLPVACAVLGDRHDDDDDQPEKEHEHEDDDDDDQSEKEHEHEDDEHEHD